MAKSRDGEDRRKEPSDRANRDRGSAGPRKTSALSAPSGGSADSAQSAALAKPPRERFARTAGPTRRQVRQIARLVGRLEALGELEARRRRQLQVALEKGRKTKRHRQQVDRTVGRVGALIDRLRTLARELESPVASATPMEPVVAPGLATKPVPKTKATSAVRAKPSKAKPTPAQAPANSGPTRTPSKPANA
jgi:hypothetical protein